MNDKINIKNTKISIIGYCRVSTDNQKEEGTIKLQEQAIREYAQAKGYDLVGIFMDEGVSGGLEHRPALSNLFDYLENHAVSCVLIYKLDRLARDLYIQEHLIKKLEGMNINLISTKEPDLDVTILCVKHSGNSWALFQNLRKHSSP